jgi:hypothetical protein
MAAVLRVAAMEARLELMSSCQRPNAGENMRRHVQGVRSRGSDLRVTASGGQSELRQLRLVVGVNQIMRDAGMVGLDGKQLLQNGGGLLAIGKSRVVVRLGGQQGERVEAAAS